MRVSGRERPNLLCRTTAASPLGVLERLCLVPRPVLAGTHTPRRRRGVPPPVHARLPVDRVSRGGGRPTYVGPCGPRCNAAALCVAVRSCVTPQPCVCVGACAPCTHAPPCHALCAPLMHG